jgi:signal transduction histidine kinase
VFEIGIEALLRIQFRALAGQVEEFDLVLALRHSLRIAVDDEGPGLPDTELEKVFEPFYRIESSRSRDTGGVGLGLAIVRQVARGHGGDVVLENRTGGGLRAVLWLPLER